MLCAKRSSTSRVASAAAFALAAAAALVALLAGRPAAALIAVGVAGAAGALLVVEMVVSERRRHALAERELAGQASFLESLVASLRAIAAASEPDEILEVTGREAERLFGARAAVLDGGEHRGHGPAESEAIVPIRARDEEIAALRLVRPRPFERGDLAQATVLADFAARAYENARLLAEARVREAERARLSDQLVTAEQDERRRLALFLHDTSVQSLSGIALLLDAAHHSVETGNASDARSVMANALERLRGTIRELRDLSFALEPVVLRDQGFGPAVHALADQLAVDGRTEFELDVEAAEALGEKAQAALYQIIREALDGAIRRGPPAHVRVTVQERGDGGFETVIADDAPGERRRASFDAIAERARTLSGQLDVEQGEGGGTTVRVILPPYTAR